MAAKKATVKKEKVSLSGNLDQLKFEESISKGLTSLSDLVERINLLKDQVESMRSTNMFEIKAIEADFDDEKGRIEIQKAELASSLEEEKKAYNEALAEMKEQHSKELEQLSYDLSKNIRNSKEEALKSLLAEFNSVSVAISEYNSLKAADSKYQSQINDLEVKLAGIRKSLDTALSDSSKLNHQLELQANTSANQVATIGKLEAEILELKGTIKAKDELIARMNEQMNRPSVINQTK